MKVFDHPPEKLPRYRALINFGSQYDGWTGKEPFGVVRKTDDGWQVFCGAAISLETPVFQQFEDAVNKLDQLMNKARRLGQLNIGANGWPHVFASVETHPLISWTCPKCKKQRHERPPLICIDCGLLVVPGEH